MPTQTFADIKKNTYFTAINAGTYHMELSVIDFKIVDKCEPCRFQDLRLNYAYII